MAKLTSKQVIELIQEAHNLFKYQEMLNPLGLKHISVIQCALGDSLRECGHDEKLLNLMDTFYVEANAQQLIELLPLFIALCSCDEGKTYGQVNWSDVQKEKDAQS